MIDVNGEVTVGTLENSNAIGSAGPDIPADVVPSGCKRAEGDPGGNWLHVDEL